MREVTLSRRGSTIGWQRSTSWPLARLFCCRLDLGAALDMELVRWNGHDDGLKRALSQVFEFSEWVQWFSDYV